MDEILIFERGDTSTLPVGMLRLPAAWRSVFKHVGQLLLCPIIKLPEEEIIGAALQPVPVPPERVAPVVDGVLRCCEAAAREIEPDHDGGWQVGAGSEDWAADARYCHGCGAKLPESSR